MYLIYGKREKNDELKRIEEKAELREEEVKYLAKEETSKEDFFSLLVRNREIDVLLFIDIPKDELKDLSAEVKEKNQDIFQIALVDRLESNKTEETEIDHLIEREEAVIDSLFRKIDEHFFKEKSRNLREVLSDCEGKIAIFVHDDPDPDAVASAVALEEICRTEDVSSKTYYGGEIGHPENELFMDYTDFMIEKITKDSIESVLDEAENIAFVDFADPSISDIIPDYITPDIIIDHHSTNKDIKAEKYTEIRTDVGSASTLMTNHLQNLNVKVQPVLASALLIGIKVDTNDYTKNISVSDFKSIMYLNSISDREIMDVLERTPIHSETLTAMGRALSNREVKNDTLTAFCGEIKHSDDISMIADFLLRERDILTVLVFGIKDKKIHMSGRSKDLQLNMGKIMDRAYSDVGEGGGHPHSAGGKTSLSKFENTEEAVETIKKRFYDEVDIR